MFWLENLMRNKGMSNLALGEKIVQVIEVKVPKNACPNESPGLDCGHCMYNYFDNI